MSETFTPGPWEVGTTFSYLQGFKIIAKQGPIDVWIGFASGGHEACLIAASPCMYEALEAALPYIHHEAEAIIANAQAALAKARGES